MSHPEKTPKTPGPGLRRPVAGRLRPAAQSLPPSRSPLRRAKEGRATGRPAKAGCKKGTPVRANVPTRERIEREADPIGFLVDMVKGKRFKAAPTKNAAKTGYVYPTLEQRQRAAEKLLSKILPGIRSVEVAGPPGGDIVVKVVRFGDDAPS